MDVDFSEHFKAPVDYSPPKDSELDGNSQFPNLNSVEFRHRQKDDIDLLPYYEILEANENQATFLLATNSYTQRLWNGAVFGYGRFSDVGKPGAEVIKLSFDSNVTGVRFVDSTMVLFTTASGSIQLWSTQSEIRQKNGYNLYQVSKKSEHSGPISGFSLLGGKPDQKVVTGSMDGCIKIWKLAPCDLVSEQTYRYAHKETITDISTKPQSNDIFASCSRDRFLQIWDKRLSKPLTNVWKNNDFANTACLWVQKDNGADHLYLGDDSGTLYIYDPRKLDQCLVTQNLFDRPIYRFKLNKSGKMVCVLAQSNNFKVISATIELETIHADSSSNGYVRDVCWINPKDENHHAFYSVGWNKNVKQHTIK